MIAARAIVWKLGVSAKEVAGVTAGTRSRLDAMREWSAPTRRLAGSLFVTCLQLCIPQQLSCSCSWCCLHLRARLRTLISVLLSMFNLIFGTVAGTDTEIVFASAYLIKIKCTKSCMSLRCTLHLHYSPAPASQPSGLKCSQIIPEVDLQSWCCQHTSLESIF